MADGFSAGYSPLTGAGNLASALGANPNFGGNTGGYNAGGYAPSTNVGVPAYASSNNMQEMLGNAGMRVYNPAISAAPAAFRAPPFGNSMTGSSGVGPFRNSISPESWNMLAASTRANQPSTQVAGGTPSIYASLAGGGGSSSNNMAEMLAEISGQGILPAAYATWPNPGTSLYSNSDDQKASLLAGIYGAEGGASASANPYQVTPAAVAQANRGGAGISTNASGQPANAAESQKGAQYLLDQYGSKYPYAGQVATAYNSGPGNVNRNYDPNVPGSTPYLSNTPIGRNVTPQQYLYGNPSSGYPGVYSGLANNAVDTQFQRAAGVGSPTYSSSGRYGGY
jgi:hypothetical protein